MYVTYFRNLRIEGKRESIARSKTIIDVRKMDR